MQTTNGNPKTCASVTFRTLVHLYDPDDPSPENNRLLTDNAENRIFREVLDIPKGHPSPLFNRMEILLPASDLTPGRADVIVSAVRAHFRTRADEIRRDMKLTVRVGLREIRLTLAVCIPSFIGIAFCAKFKGDPLVEVTENVLVIFCWVTIWQPFQSLVFDRWTLAEQARVYRKIAEMEITIKPA
jgi:hypothetical protein